MNEPTHCGAMWEWDDFWVICPMPDRHLDDHRVEIEGTLSCPAAVITWANQRAATCTAEADCPATSHTLCCPSTSRRPPPPDRPGPLPDPVIEEPM